VRAAEVAGAVVALAVVVLAVFVLRGRFDFALPNQTQEVAPPLAAAPGQLALGGTATIFPTLTLTSVPPTRTPLPTETLSPTREPTLPPTATPLPQTGGPPARPESTYIIQAGDTLLAIAIKHGISLDQLVEANNLPDVKTLILPGQTLTIPRGDEEPGPSSEPQPADASAQAASAEPTKAEAPATEAPATQAPAASAEPIGQKTYTIQRGDSLWGISLKVGVSVEGLMALNGFKSTADFPNIGSVIIVSAGVTVTPAPPKPTPVPPTAVPTRAPTAVPTSTNTPVPTATAIPLPSATEPPPTRSIPLAPTEPAPTQAAIALSR